MSLILFGSFVWAVIVIAILLVIFFIADLEENGFMATIALVVSGILFYVWGKESFMVITSLFTFKSIIIYFGFGLVHALVRIFFHGRKEMQKVNDAIVNKDSYHPKIDMNVKSDVFRWWFLWPISLIVWIVQDMIGNVYNYCYDKFATLFNKILMYGVKSVKPVKPEL